MIPVACIFFLILVAVPQYKIPSPQKTDGVSWKRIFKRLHGL